jgi:hypothetical protein
MAITSSFVTTFALVKDEPDMDAHRLQSGTGLQCSIGVKERAGKVIYVEFHLTSPFTIVLS